MLYVEMSTHAYDFLKRFQFPCVVVRFESEEKKLDHNNQTGRMDLDAGLNQSRSHLLSYLNPVKSRSLIAKNARMDQVRVAVGGVELATSPIEVHFSPTTPLLRMVSFAWGLCLNPLLRMVAAFEPTPLHGGRVCPHFFAWWPCFCPLPLMVAVLVLILHARAAIFF